MSAKIAFETKKPGFTPCLLTSAESRRLVDSAKWHSTRIGRARGIRHQDQDDLRQDILVDVLTRLPWFDSAKSPFGAFVDFLAGHAAGRFAARYHECRQQTKYLNISECSPVHEQGQRLPLWDGLGAEWAMMQRLALSRLLRSSVGIVVGKLIAECLAPSPGVTGASQITRWRHRRNLRLLLLLHGIDRPP